MSRIFISYAHEERPFVDALVRPLSRVYKEVWFDTEIRLGDQWWKEILDQISRCKIFLIVLSKDWMTSKVCKEEYDAAVKQGKKLLPVKVDDAELPDYLQDVQFLNIPNGVLNGDNLTELYAAINSISDEMAEAQRRRTNRLRWLAGIAVAALVTVTLMLGSTQSPRFQGQIAYISRPRDGVNQEVRLLQGGISGFIRNVLKQGPIRFSNVKASPISKIAMSPDGKRIVFASQIQESDLQSIDLNLYIFNIETGEIQQMTVDAGDNVNPTWSPDGRQIAFASNRDGNWEIYRMNVDGSNLVNLTNDAQQDNFPAWSPGDGSYIAFMTDRDGNWEIYRMNTEGGGLKNLTANPSDDQMPAWSPDGKQIAFESNRLTQDSNLLDDLDPSVQTFNPCMTISRDIGITDFDGRTVNWPVNRRDSDDRSPSWSPDGRYIVFSSDRRNGNDLYIAEVRTGFEDEEAVLLTEDQLEDDSFPIWQV